MRIRIEVEANDVVLTIEREVLEAMFVRSEDRAGAVRILGDVAGRMVVALSSGIDVPLDTLMESFHAAADRTQT
jgi:hypothetical protein